MMASVALLIGACDERGGGHLPAAEIARNGFYIGRTAAEVSGREVKLSGFVDHGNLYGDAGAKEILREWWGGDGSDSGTWRFNLKGGVTALRLAAAQHHRAIVQLLRARGAE